MSYDCDCDCDCDCDDCACGPGCHGSIYDDDGTKVYDPWVARQQVERTCCYCGRTFLGMPDHGVCNRCCDVLERGGDPC